MKHILARAFVGLALTCSPMLVSSETLIDALVDGYENSGLLRQNQALLRVADEDIATAVAALRPIITWIATSTAMSPNPFADDTITVSLELAVDLTVFDGGSNRIAIVIQEETMRAVRASLTNVEQQVLMRVINAHFDVRRTLQIVALQTTNVDLVAQELDNARVRFDVGEITRTDVSLTQARLAAARAELAAAQGDLVVATEEFRAAVGRDPGVLRKASVIPLTYTRDEALATALRIHPDILEAERRIGAANLRTLLADAAMRPSGTLRGEFDVDHDLEQSRTLRLTIEGPIYSGGALSSALRQAQAEVDRSRAILRVATQGVYQNVNTAYTCFNVARAEITASQKQVGAARVVLSSTQEEARLGSRTQLDILNARQDLVEAETSLISSRIEDARARYVILEAVGELTAIGLGLPVETYDPAAYYNQVRDAPAALSDQGRALDRILDRILDRGVQPQWYF